MKANLGCGSNLMRGWVNVDHELPQGRYVMREFATDHLERSYHPNPERPLFCQHNLEAVPYENIEDNQFTNVLLDNVLEHLRNPMEVLTEIHRITHPGGYVDIKVPHQQSDSANLVTHKWLYNEHSLRPLTTDDQPHAGLDHEPLFYRVSTDVTYSHPFAWHMREYLGFDFPIGSKQGIRWILRPIKHTNSREES